MAVLPALLGRTNGRERVRILDCSEPLEFHGHAWASQPAHKNYSRVLMAKQPKKTKAAAAHSKQHLISYGARKVPPRQNKLLAILQSGRAFTKKALAEKLETSTFTVVRDIKALFQEHGIEIEYIPQIHSYRLKEKVTAPKKTLNLPFTEGELNVLRIAAKALITTTPDTGLGHRAMKVHEKLSLMLPELSSDEGGDDSITFDVVSRPIYRKGVLRKLLDFYRRRRRIKMYYETDPNPPEWREADVYGVRLINEMIYFVAYCHNNQTERTFCATRIWDLKEAGESYEIPDDFDIDKFLAGNFGIVGGKKYQKVVVRFAKKFSYLIRERRWKGEVNRITLPDGSFELHLRLKNLWEFEKMLKGHPGDFTVLEPAELRESIVKGGTALVRNNTIQGKSIEITAK